MIKKLTEWNPIGRRPKGRTKRRWMEDVGRLTNYENKKLETESHQ
jgi:hypothetical protein